MANTGSPGMVLFAYISFALGGVLVVGGCIYMIIWAFCNKCLPCGRRSGAKADGRQVGHAKYMDKNLSGRGNASAQEGDTESLNYEGHTFLPRDATTGQDKDHKQTRAQVEETNRRSNGAVISVHEENELGMVRRESSKNKDDKKRQGMVIGTAAAATTTAVVAGATTIIISEHKDNADEGRNEGGGGEDAIRTDNDRGLYDDQLDTNSNTNLVQNEDTHTFMSAAVIDESMGDGDRTMNEHPESSQYIEDNMGREEYMAQPSSQQQVAEVEEHIEPVEAISNKRLQTFYDDYTQEGSSTVIGAQEQEDWRRQGMGTQSEEFDEVSAGRATQIELRQSEDEESTFKGISHDNWQEDIVHVTPDADRNEVDNNLEVEKDQTPLLQESFGVEEVSYHQDSVVDVGRKGSIDEMVQRNSQGEPFFSDLTDSMQKNYEIDDEVTYNSNNHDMSVIEREESFHVQQSNYPIDLSNPDVQEEVMNNDERLLQQLQDIDRQDSAQSTGGGITTIQTNLGEGSGVESPEVVNEQSIHSVANEHESDEDRGMSLAAVGVTGASLAGDKILRKKKKRSSLFSKEHKGEDNQDVEMTNLPPQDIDSPDEDDARGGGKRKSKKEKEKEEKLKKKEKQKEEELQRKLDKEQERERKKLLEREKKESKKLNKKQKASESTQIITAGVPLIATSRNEDNAEVEMENFSEERFGASHLEEEEQRCTNEGHVVEAAAIPILETAKENQKKDRTKQEKEQEDKERRKEKEHLERESKKEKERQKKERELQIKREKEEEKLKKKQQEQEEKERRKMSKKKQAEDVKEDDKQDHDHEQVETSREEVKGEKEGRKQKEKEEKERKKELEREEGESKKERERQQKEDELKQKRMKEEEKIRRKQQEKEERADRKKSKIEKEEMGEKQYEQDHEVTAAAAPIVAAVKESKKDKRNKRESKKINKESVETSQGEDEEHHLAPTAAVPIVQQEEDTERIEEKRGKEGKKEKEKEEKERKKELERQERESKKERERQRKEEESQRKREKEEEKMRKKQLEREERESKKKKKIEKDEAEELQHEQDHGVMAAAVPIIQQEEETERAEEKGEKEGKKEKEKEERERKKELERQERESKKERERQRKEEELQRKREKEEEKLRKKQKEHEERESRKMKKKEKGAMKTEMEGARTDEEEQTVSYGDEFLAGAKDSKKYKNSKKKEKDSKRKKRDDNRGSEEEQLEGTEHKAEDSPDLRRQLNDDLVESSESKKEKKSWLGFQKPKHSSGTEEDSSNVLYAAAPIAGTAAVGAVAAAVVTGTYDKTGGHQPDVGTLGEAPGSAWQENNLMTDDDHEDHTTVINKNLLPAEGDSDSLLIADSPGPRARSSPILYEEDEYQDSSFGATGGMAIKKELAVKDDEGYQTHDQDGDSSAHDIQFDRDSSGEQRPLIVNDDFDDTRHQHMEELGKPGVDMVQTNVNQGYEYINNDERQEEEHFQDMDDQRKSGPDMTQTKVNQGYEYINNDEGQEEEHFEDMEDQRKSGPDMTQTNVNQGYEYINYDERQKEEHFEDMEDKRKSGPDMTQTYENQGHEYSDEIRGEANHEDTKYDRQPYTDTADQHRETEVYSQHDNSEVEREHISDVRASTSGPSDWEEAAESQFSTGRTEQTSLTSTQREAWDSQNVQRETAGSIMAVAPSFTDEIQASSRNNDDDEDMPISKSILADIRQKRNLKTPIRSDSIETNEDKDGTLFDELHTVLRSKKKDERESAEIVYDVDDTKYTGNGKAANEHLTEEYDISKFNVRARASLFEKITESTGEKVIPSFGGVTATHSYIRPLSPTVMRLTEGASDKSGISDTTEHRDIITDAESDQVEYHYKPSRDSLATTDRMTPSVDEQSEYQHKPARDSLVSQDLQSYHADERREQDNESPTNGHFHTFDRNEDSFDEPVDAIRHSAEETDSAVQYQDLETLTNYHLTNGDYITNGHSENAFDIDDGHHSFSEEPPEAQDLDKSMTNIKVKELNRMSVHDNFNSEVDASMVF